MADIRQRLNTLREQAYKGKWKCIIDNNTGLHRLEKINNILQGTSISETDLEEWKSKYTLVELATFQYAPMSSPDVERIFSQYKCIFRDNRH